MATRKALVMNTGRIERLQSGDTLNADVAEIDLIEVNNGNAGTIDICQAVYIDGNDSVDLAKADAAGTMDMIGLVKDVTIVSSADGMVQTDGILAATTGQWDAVTGDTGGLTAGTVYYLDASTAGFITSTAPITVSQFVVQLGRAISTTEMEISICDPIKL